MKKFYNDLDKSDEKSKKQGYFDLNREPCFAETSIDSCSALREKNCFECSFYKPAINQMKVVTKDTLKEIDSYKGLIPDQKLKELRQQVRSGDVAGARISLYKIKKQGGL